MGRGWSWLFLGCVWSLWAHGLACFQLLRHAADLNPAAVVSIYLNPQLTTRQRSAVLEKLARQDLILLNQPDHSPLIAQLGAPSARLISEVPGVERVTQAYPQTLKIWKQGRSWIRPRAPLMDNDLAANWLQRAAPLRGMGSVSLKRLRQTARDYGVVVVMNRSRPATEAEIEKESFLFGGTVLYADDLPEDPGLIQLPGLALHLQPNSRALAVRGTLNPLQSRSRALADMNKVEEMRVFQRYSPDAIAPWITVDKILASSVELDEQRLNTLDQVNEFLKTRTVSLSEIRMLNNQLRRYFDAVVAARPPHLKSFYIKHRDDFATMEAEQRWTNYNFSAAPNARVFYAGLKYAKSAPGSRGKPLQSPEVEQHLDYENRMVILRNLLLGGSEVFLQQTLPVRHSRRRNNVEFRVGVFQGRVVSSHFRFNQECYPEEAEQAASFVADVFARLPPVYRTLSAGLDVVQLEDRTFRIVEANFGTDSSFALPDTIPVYANTAISNFVGRPTPLIRYLNTAFENGVEAQVEALKKARAEQPADKEVAALRVEDVFVYFRDRYLDNWRATHKTRKTRLKENPYHYLYQLLALAGEQYDLELYYLVQVANEYWTEATAVPAR